jgi:hypothetical protein
MKKQRDGDRQTEMVWERDGETDRKKNYGEKGINRKRDETKKSRAKTEKL